MKNTLNNRSESGAILRDLSLPWRGLLSVFVVVMGFGYAAALINLQGQNEYIDGRPGLSAQDLILKFHGGFTELTDEERQQSRMLRMALGPMRANFENEQHLDTVRQWLENGAEAEGFGDGQALTPRGVITSDCLPCHGANSGRDIALTAPFGPTTTEADLVMIAKFTTPPENRTATVWQAPRGWRQLALSTHTHLLGVPVFVGIMGALFLATGWPAGANRIRLRMVMACAPLVLFLADVSCWWLARLPNVGPAFAMAIPVAGGLFGLTYSTQGVAVLVTTWRRPAVEVSETVESDLEPDGTQEALPLSTAGASMESVMIRNRKKAS